MIGSLLFITPDIQQVPRGGRASLSELHEQALREIVGDGFSKLALPPAPPAGRLGSLAALCGAIDGVTPAAEAAIAERIASEGITTVYLDGSNLGRLARAIKRRRPATRVITFFHNVEARFFFGAARARPSFHTAAVLVANLVAERMAVRNSDHRLVLCCRDGKQLARIYRRGATDLLPMALIDRKAAASGPGRSAPRGDYLLFVGGAFYANRDGIGWFARHVAPRLTIPCVVVGIGMEAMREELERARNVVVIGAVDDLAPWYQGASAVVAPIFDGSGMKTKVAEALMHGKRIIGTREAFTGYEAAADRAGWQCETSDEFVRAVEELTAMAPARFDPELRELFKRYYSVAATTARLTAILGDTRARVEQ